MTKTIKMKFLSAIPRKKGGLDILENLISLCHKCHLVEEFKDYVNISSRPIRVRAETYDGLAKLA